MALAQWGPVDAFAQAYGPVAQFSDSGFALVHTWFSPSWIVRTRGNVPGLPEAMRRALQSVDPQLPFSSFANMTELRANSLSQQRYLATLFSTLAGLALLLAALGSMDWSHNPSPSVRARWEYVWRWVRPRGM